MLLLAPALMIALLTPPADTGSAELHTALDTPTNSLMRWGDLGDVRVALRTAYDGHLWEPYWLVGGKPTPAARLVLKEIGSARDRGLDPLDYDATRLAAEVDSLTGRDDSRAARFDIALSAAVVRYALALDRGRVDPRTLHPTLMLKREAFDATAFLADASQAAQPAASFRALEPRFYQYRRLQAALVTYRILAQDSTLLSLPELPRKLKVGTTYAGAPQLRRLLTLIGDLSDSSAVHRAGEGDSIYDKSLEQAIRRFQRRQGFSADGVVGDSTRARLLHPFDERVRSIELTLERWRWLPRRFDVPPIIVNIPGYRLTAFSTAQDVEADMLAMNVVVGAAVKHDTPLLAVDLVAVQFHPSWNVPKSIAKDEILPKARKDPGYLAKEHYELLRGRTVVPAVDSNIRRIGTTVQVRQTPGSWNALGRVKFVMPNAEDIYLHDTPSKGFFARARRDFSHGCIRVSDPMALAAFLLRDRAQWPADSVKSVMTTDSVTRWVPLTARVPVFLVYQTVTVSEAGETFFYGDVYGHDRTLDQVLRKGYPYPAAGVTDLKRSTAVVSAP
ncbi:MAG: L,D-transpeptidase family protein [Gemmatimonadota bacterium]